MSRHDSAGHRCARCRMHRTLCICALLPRIETPTRLVLLLHQLEARKTTNTGRIAALCLAGSRVVVRGRSDGDGHGDGDGAAAAAGDGGPLWAADSDPLLLFPHEGARPLESWRGSIRPLTLIVPDGTWSQAGRARRRVPGLADIPCAVIPEGAALGAPPFRLRRDLRPGRLSTLAAIAIALGVLEGEAVQRALERVLAVMVDRTLWTNGRIRTADVTGGIPAGVAAHQPAGRGQPGVV
jgi:DTW domain-containing protein